MIKSQIPNPKSHLVPSTVSKGALGARQTIYKSQFPNSKLSVCPACHLTESRIPLIRDNLWFVICSLFVICNLLLGIYPLYSLAQENEKLVTLSKQIIEAKSNEELYPLFEGLKGLYFKDNRYKDFVEILKSLGEKKKESQPFINYYIALSRYHQLKYLEEIESWEEYFSEVSIYRDEITQGLHKTIDVTTTKDPLYIYAKLLLWQFHKDGQDVFSDSALSDLMDSAFQYSKDTTEATAIKEVADRLSSYGSKGESKELYKIYIDKLITSNIEDEELSNIALGFYKEGNLELSGVIYNVYMQRIAGYPKKELIPILIEIAKTFSYDDEGPRDAFYAEAIFAKIEEIDSEYTFDEGLIYLRAFNLEKAKEYNKAKDIYVDLVTLYPESSYVDEANFKIGIIYTYILGDIETGRSYFEKLTQKKFVTPQVISSLYQLGLLSQWEENLAEAKEYYNKLIEEAGDDFIETLTLAKERLKEIQEKKPIEYNLKTFLDVSLKEEYNMLEMTNLDLRASAYRTNIDKEININSSAYPIETGCMQVELQYLWSGHVGTTKPSPKQPSFTTTYIHTGSKEINLVVVSPFGVIDRNIDTIDIY